MERAFSEADIERVWQKGTAVPNSTIWRKDQCTAWIKRDEYGNRSSVYGWEIDHIDPDGGDDLSNLRPLQWKNNASRQDNRLTCPVTSSGTQNVES